LLPKNYLITNVKIGIITTMSEVFRKFSVVIVVIIAITFSFIACVTGNGDNDLTPTVTDFDISGTGTFTYNGNPKTVTITPKAGKSQGVITIYYNGTITAPSAVGTYAVTFNIEAATGWNAVSGLTAGTIIIANNDPTLIIYISYDTSGNAYTLVITKDTNNTASSPQVGDAYVLTITAPDETILGSSTGTVKVVSGATFSLEKGNDTFTVTVNDSEIANISNVIPLDNGGTRPSPASLIPNKPSESNGNGKYNIVAYSYNAEDELTGYIEYEYDSNGNQTKASSYNENGEMYRYLEYEYDSNGNRTLFNQYNYSNGNLTSHSEYKYDSYGNQTKTNYYNEKGVLYMYGEYEYEYDFHGNKTKETIYVNGKLSSNREYEYENEYDSHGNKTKESIFTDGELSYYYEYEYDYHENLMKESYYSANGSVLYEYEYDSYGKLMKANIYNLLIISEYDSNGILTKASYYNADGELTNYVIYVR